jgi:hypothetical protein
MVSREPWVAGGAREKGLAGVRVEGKAMKVVHGLHTTARDRVSSLHVRPFIESSPRAQSINQLRGDGLSSA